MKEIRTIDGKAKTVRELLKGVKYSIDYYQREYKWHDKQIRELVDDLTRQVPGGVRARATPADKVADYPHYFLGSIIISRKEGASYHRGRPAAADQPDAPAAVLLRNLQKARAEQVNVDELIVSEKYGQKSFNLHVDERTPCDGGALRRTALRSHRSPGVGPEPVPAIPATSRQPSRRSCAATPCPTSSTGCSRTSTSSKSPPTPTMTPTRSSRR